MADYIERTEALILAMNAGARAIENTKRYHGASYTRDAFSADSKTIPYLEAARVLREASDAPAASVAEVEHGEPVTKIRTVMLTGYHEEIGVFAKDGSNLYRKKMAQADIPYDHCPVCSDVLCSRWHNFCGKCGAKMDGGQQHE